MSTEPAKTPPCELEGGQDSEGLGAATPNENLSADGAPLLSSGLSTLVIELREGFSDDRVVIEVNGELVFDKEEVNTDYSIGLADLVELPIPEGTATVQVEVPSRRLSGTIESEATKTLYLRAVISEDKLELEISETLVPYV